MPLPRTSGHSDIPHYSNRFRSKSNHGKMAAALDEREGGDGMVSEAVRRRMQSENDSWLIFGV